MEIGSIVEEEILSTRHWRCKTLTRKSASYPSLASSPSGNHIDVHIDMRIAFTVRASKRIGAEADQWSSGQLETRLIGVSARVKLLGLRTALHPEAPSCCGVHIGRWPGGTCAVTTTADPGLAMEP